MLATPAFNIQRSDQRLIVGFDLVALAGVRDSVAQFGERFTQRLFTDAELCYAYQGANLWPERLAARFAAKEATIKALNLSDAGISWRDIEVVKLPGGGCALALHGPVVAMSDAEGVTQWALSLSHDGDYAGAFVVGLCGSGQALKKI